MPFSMNRTGTSLLISWVFLFCFPGLSQGQTVGKIAGRITDAETGEPLVGCNVMVLGTALGGRTDPEGAYFILNLSAGKYDLQASMVGFQRKVQSGVIVNAGKTTTVPFALSPTLLEQQAVVVQATRPDVEPEKTSTSAVLRFEDVEAIAGMRDIGDVLGLAADITDGHFRGGREGEELYTLQGMGIVNPLTNSTAFLPIMSAVEEVEVITSGFGAQYGNAQSGVVNISMKEGQPDLWRTRIEARMRMPGRKHFGPNVFDPAENPYLALLNDSLSIWLQGDPNTNRPYYQSFGLNNVFGGDTAAQLAAARTIWRYQTKRDIYRTYGDALDHSVEIATGGPIDNGLRMFMALRSNLVWPTFPTEQPDVQRQLMGNIVADAGAGATLQLSGGYAREDLNVFPSSNNLGFYSWLWDRILSVNYQNTDNIQAGLRFTQMLSPSTYYELKLHGLWTTRHVGSTPAPPAVADSLIFPIPQVDWDKVLIGPSNVPDNFYYERGDDLFRQERTRTLSFEASLTSQITIAHLLNAGIQANVHRIEVENALGTREGSGGPVEIVHGHPLRGGALRPGQDGVPGADRERRPQAGRLELQRRLLHRSLRPLRPGDGLGQQRGALRSGVGLPWPRPLSWAGCSRGQGSPSRSPSRRCSMRTTDRSCSGRRSSTSSRSR